MLPRPQNACCPSNAPPNSETWRRHCEETRLSSEIFQSRTDLLAYVVWSVFQHLVSISTMKGSISAVVRHIFQVARCACKLRKRPQTLTNPFISCSNIFMHDDKRQKLVNLSCFNAYLQNADLSLMCNQCFALLGETFVEVGCSEIGDMK